MFLDCFGLVFLDIPNPIKEFIIIVSYIAIVKKQNRYKFSFLIICFFLLLLLNLIMCQWKTGQTLLSGIRGTEFANFFMLGSYFLFHYIKADSNKLEDTLDILCIIFCTSYLIQQAVYPYAIFKGAEIIEYNITDVFRIRLYGQAITFISFAKGLNGLLNGSYSKRKIYLYMFISSLFVTFFLGFRTQILLFAILTLYMIWKISGSHSKVFKSLSLFTLLLLSIIQIPSVQSAIYFILERAQNDNFDNSDYVRLREFTYYTTVHIKSFSDWFWGTGLPGLNSSYSNDINTLKMEGLIWADWGLIGLSWLLGIPATLLFLYILISPILLKQNKKHFYIEVCFIYLILGSIFQRECFRTGNQFIIGILLYIAEQANFKMKKEKI